MYGEAADAATPGFKARESGSVWPKPGSERPLSDIGMENPSLRDLPGFTSSFLGFVEGAPAPGPLSPDHPRKELLFSRCRAASRQIPLCAVASQTIREETPIFARSRRWSENVERLESSSAVVVGVSADTATFSTSLVPLLKCLTAIKLAGEISREGIPAVPLLWVDFPDWTGGSNTKNSDNAEANRAGIGEADKPLKKLTNDFNNTLEVLSYNELYRAKIDGILKWLIDEFGLVLVNPLTVGLRLIHSRILKISGDWLPACASRHGRDRRLSMVPDPIPCSPARRRRDCPSRCFSVSPCRSPQKLSLLMTWPGRRS